MIYIHQAVQRLLDRYLIAQHEKEIEVFYLPPYSPEHYPDKYLNGDFKRNVHSGYLPRTKDDLKHKFRSFIKRLQFNPAHVKSYFRAKHVRYAA